jgi:hypothetical protein
MNAPGRDAGLADMPPLTADIVRDTLERIRR